MKLVALIIIPIVIWFYSTKCYSHAENVTIWVIRRYSGDFYSWKLSNSHEVCDHNRPTYMVEEQQCVQNDDLLDKCRFALDDNLTSNRTLYMPWSEDYLATGIMIIDTKQQKNNIMSLNISLCQIASLEVYRGKTNVFEIKHSGFTLTDRNTIQVDEEKLAYNSSEYVGELFHMKLSCPHGQEEIAQSECLFFKVGGKTTVTEPKFNCTVPGTRFGYSTVYPPKPTTSIAAQTTTNVISDSILVTTTIATNLTLLNERQPSKSEVGSRLFYAVVGVGSGMVTLLMCCLCCVCAMLICRQHRTKVSAITSTEMERRISTASRQTEAKNEKDTELELYVHMYAVPSEVIPSNTYGCNCLEDNPAYLKPGFSTDCSEMNCGKSEEMLECGNAIIPPEKSLDHDYDGNKEEPLYQEILPKAELKSSLPQPKESSHPVVTTENVFYQTTLHLQQQWKEDCVPSGHPKPFQIFPHLKQ